MNTLNLAWSLRPLLIFCRCIGIDLLTDSLKRRKICYAFFCIILNIMSQIVTNFFCLQAIFSTGKIGQDTFNSVTSSLNAIIAYLNYAITASGSHLIFLLVIRPRWVALIKTFQRFENQLEPKFFIKLRWFSFIGVGFIILLV